MGVEVSPPSASNADMQVWLDDMLRTTGSIFLNQFQEDVSRRLVEHHQALQIAVTSRMQGCPASFVPAMELEEQTTRRRRSTMIGLGEYQDRSEDRGSIISTIAKNAPNDCARAEERSDSGTLSWSAASLTRKTAHEINVNGYKSRVLCELAGVDHASEKRNSMLGRIVSSKKFETLCALIIFACTLTMAVEIQYNGLGLGYDLSMPNYVNSKEVAMPGAGTAFRILEVVYNLCFIVELLLRLVVGRLRALRSLWIWFDAILVFLGWVDYFGAFVVGMEPAMLRVLRLARVLRLVKLLKSTRMFETLFLLIRSLQSSRGALAWSFALMWSVQFAAGLALCQLLSGFIADEDGNAEARRQVFRYFGTFSHAILTMFEITLGNWVVPCRLLYNSVSEWYGLFFIVYRGCLMFALVKVITAVFVAETTRATQSDDELTLQKRTRAMEVNGRKLREVFRELDVSGNGYLTREEFEPIISDGIMKAWLATIGIDTCELEHLFSILDTSDGGVSLDEFISGMTRIKGPAKSVDVLKMMNGMNHLAAQLDELITHSATQQRLSVIPAMIDLKLSSMHASIMQLATAETCTRTEGASVKGWATSPTGDHFPPLGKAETKGSKGGFGSSTDDADFLRCQFAKDAQKMVMPVIQGVVSEQFDEQDGHICFSSLPLEVADGDAVGTDVGRVGTLPCLLSLPKHPGCHMGGPQSPVWHERPSDKCC